MAQLLKTARIVSPSPDRQPIALALPRLVSLVSVALRDLGVEPYEPRDQTAA